MSDDFGLDIFGGMLVGVAVGGAINWQRTGHLENVGGRGLQGGNGRPRHGGITAISKNFYCLIHYAAGARARRGAMLR